MPAMLSKLYHALLTAGVDDATATAAAEEAAQSDQRFAALDVKLEALKGELQWVKWMLGTNIILTLGVLWKLLK